MDEPVPADQRRAGAVMVVSGLMNAAMSFGFIVGLLWMCGLGLLWTVPLLLSVVEVGLGVSLIRGRQRPTNTLLPALGALNSLLVFNPLGVLVSLFAFWQMGSEDVAGWLGLKPAMPPIPASPALPAALPDPEAIATERIAELRALAAGDVLADDDELAARWRERVAETGRIYASEHRDAWREARERADALADSLDGADMIARKRALRAARDAADRWLEVAAPPFFAFLAKAGDPRAEGGSLRRIVPADVDPSRAMDADNLVWVADGPAGDAARALLVDIALALHA